MILQFTWESNPDDPQLPQRGVVMMCGESRTGVGLPPGMSGLDRVEINPGNLTGSRFWIDDIIWEL